MAISIDPKQVVSFEELLMFQVVHAEAFTRLLVEKGVVTQEELMVMVKVVDRDMKRTRKEKGLVTNASLTHCRLFLANDRVD